LRGGWEVVQAGVMLDLMAEDEWPVLLARCAAALDLEASARAYGAFQRPRGVRSAAALLRLALGYGPGGLSLRQAAAWAEVGGLAAGLSRTALMNRLRSAADWLGALAGALAADRVPAPDALGRRPLCLVDGSALCAPGSRTTDWRLHVAYDPCAQRFTALDLTDAGGAERLDRAAVTPDEIRIGDRGHATRPEGVRALTEGPGDYVVRVGWRGLHWLDPAGGRFDVLAFLAGIGGDAAGRGEAPVLVGRARARAGFAPVPARLIALRLPPEAAARARRRAERASRRGGHRVRPGTLEAAEYLLLLTSLDARDYPSERVAALYRLRWQVELAIKRLKSLLHIDRLPAKSPDLARAWLYAHLIAALLIDDLVQDARPGALPPRGGRHGPRALTLGLGQEPGPGRHRRRPRPPPIPQPPHRRHAAPAPPFLRSTPEAATANAGVAMLTPMGLEPGLHVTCRVWAAPWIAGSSPATTSTEVPPCIPSAPLEPRVEGVAQAVAYKVNRQDS
jgi:Transposase DDE domain